RAHWVTGNTAPVDALIAALEARGLNALAVFGPSLPAILASGLIAPGAVDLLITTTSFSIAPLSPWGRGGRNRSSRWPRRPRPTSDLVFQQRKCLGVEYCGPDAP